MAPEFAGAPCVKQKARILDALKDGPATTPEVVALTGLPLKHCCAILRDLWQAGILVREPFRRDKLPSTFLYKVAP
jgi:DNA-binding IclR family transcriptional regulator